jgi:sirohydrochlorin ferrochelatase
MIVPVIIGATRIVAKGLKNMKCMIVPVIIGATRIVAKGLKNMKCMIVPVIIGATRIVAKGLKNNLKATPRKHSVDSLQKTAILGTSHTIRKVLQCET